MPSHYDEFRAVLAEIFQLDRADLDFGLYRIMNQKRDEITRFLEQDLLPQVRAAFGEYQEGDQASLEAELKKHEENARQLGLNPDDSPKVQELRVQYTELTSGAVSHENEVFSHLAQFFRRYYDKGDFLSLPRYKKGVYAIPYEGEEVKLHWANADQYYIKSSENFRDYAFTLPDQRRVHFKLVEADTETDNNKAGKETDRRFILADLATPAVEEDGELIIRFLYRNDSEKRKQTAINAASAAAILNSGIDLSWRDALAAPKPSAKNGDRTLLDVRLADYTARNTFDYFIHKDLGGFLRRELDFYIKNDIVHLDDIEHETAPRVEQYLSRIKVVRRIAHKIIDFLAQIENFQKKLWLKKKFVVETGWCVTLDRVPESLYAEIVDNTAQRDAWVTLFAINEIAASTITPAYSAPLTVNFLKANPHLVLDTQFFTPDFTERLLASFDNLDAQTDGLLIASENFQALNLLQTCYKEQIKCIYIDPPYNTGDDGFPYKDNYQHSSWMSMMWDRLLCTSKLMKSIGIILINIDYVEVSRLRLLCDQVFGSANFLADIAWEKRYTRSNNAKLFYSLKDTILCYRASRDLEELKEVRSEKSRANYTNPDNDIRGSWLSSSYVNPAVKVQRRNLVYKIKNPYTGVEIEHPTHAWKYDATTHRQHVEENRLYWGVNGDYEYPRLKTFLTEASTGMVPIDIWYYKEAGTTDFGGSEIKDLFGRSVFDNPKPTTIVRKSLQLSSEYEATVLDFFAGSGTTGHAVINLNREDEGKRKYILVEMGDYFDTVLKPRIQKVIYSKDWKDGKPVSRQGSSHMFKYLRLESYEDTLNNLELKRTPAQDLALDMPEASAAREEYMLRYMLDVESRGSASLLNLSQLAHPFDYMLNIAAGSAGQTLPAKVDLIETFNYLLGLTVEKRETIERVRVVQGRTPDAAVTLILWRDVEGTPNEALEAWWRERNYAETLPDLAAVYVNGPNTLGRLQGERWTVRSLEEEFQSRMFESAGEG